MCQLLLSSKAMKHKIWCNSPLIAYQLWQFLYTYKASVTSIGNNRLNTLSQAFFFVNVLRQKVILFVVTPSTMIFILNRDLLIDTCSRPLP